VFGCNYFYSEGIELQRAIAYILGKIVRKFWEKIVFFKKNTIFFFKIGELLDNFVENTTFSHGLGEYKGRLWQRNPSNRPCNACNIYVC